MLLLVTAVHRGNTMIPTPFLILVPAWGDRLCYLWIDSKIKSRSHHGGSVTRTWTSTLPLLPHCLFQWNASKNGGCLEFRQKWAVGRGPRPWALALSASFRTSSPRNLPQENDLSFMVELCQLFLPQIDRKALRAVTMVFPLPPSLSGTLYRCVGVSWVTGEVWN